MSIEIRMPMLSETTRNGTLLQWHVAEGEEVKCGQIIAEIEIDRAIIELEADVDGRLSALEAAEGETLDVGSLIAVLEPKASRPARQGTKRRPATLSKPSALQDDVPASPAARKLARQEGVDLLTIGGSGPGGRIVMADVERARLGKGKNRVTATVDNDGDQASLLEAPASTCKSVKIRHLVARKMEEAWKSIPHFYVTMSVDMTDVIRFRKDLGYTINDFILAATCHALMEHPWVNGMWDGEKSVELSGINLALAVDSECGLYYPVIQNCEKLSLRQMSSRARALAEKAHSGTIKGAETEGGTFTITNMGMLGVESFGAIITPPQAAVLAVGTVKGEVVVDDQGEPAVAPVMRLTLSADHRVLDGADAAGFLDTLKSYLEAPIMLVAD